MGTGTISRFLVAAAVALLAVPFVGACGGAPDEQSAGSTESLSVHKCPSGYTLNCDSGPDVPGGISCSCDLTPEQDTCTPGNASNAAWLAAAGCTPVPTVVSKVGSTLLLYNGPADVWTCSHLAAVPSTPSIDGDQGGACARNTGHPRLSEHVSVMVYDDGQHPFCGAPPSVNGICSFHSLNSSCFPDPAPGQFLVFRWFETLCRDNNPGGCHGGACECSAGCGTY